MFGVLGDHLGRRVEGLGSIGASGCRGVGEQISRRPDDSRPASAAQVFHSDPSVPKVPKSKCLNRP